VPYQIEVGSCVRKEISRLPRDVQARVLVAVRALAGDPRPVGCRPIKGAEAGTYRIRVGDYRVAYVVLDREQVVVLARVARRSEGTYRGLA
jgi:mRNA interferase RelE/StbE